MSIRLQHPLPGAGLTARFGWRPGFTEGGRYVPPMLHNGADFGAASGTLIRAAHAGRVTWVGWDDIGGGWMVMISSARFSTLYGHMRERSTLVRAGDEVKPGQPIGRVGMTGLATGNHLHFMLRLNGIDVDPLPYLAATPTPKPPPPAPPPPPPRKETTMLGLKIVDGDGRYGNKGETYFATYDGRAFMVLSKPDANAISVFLNAAFANVSYAAWEGYKAAAEYGRAA